METNPIFKQIYKDLKEEIIKNSNEIFVKEYTIPSINYSKDEDINELYFISGIEMELNKMMNCFENKIYFLRYKDKYFFSNNKEIIKEKVKKTLEKETLKEQIDGRMESRQIPYLKEKLCEKVDNEYKSFIEKLKKMTPEEIIESSYEKVSKEEMIYKIKDRDYEYIELIALLKNDSILDECYDKWMDTDSNFNELLDYPVDESIEDIVEEYKKEMKEKKQESR